MYSLCFCHNHVFYSRRTFDIYIWIVSMSYHFSGLDPMFMNPVHFFLCMGMRTQILMSVHCIRHKFLIIFLFCNFKDNFFLPIYPHLPTLQRLTKELLLQLNALFYIGWNFFLPLPNTHIKYLIFIASTIFITHRPFSLHPNF